MLSKEAILEFQNLYKQEFETEISFEEASAHAGNLLRLYQAVYKDHPKDKDSSCKDT